MTLLDARKLLDAAGIHRILAYGFIVFPVLSAVIAWKKGRSIVLWTIAAFFAPLVVPFAFLPFGTVFPVLHGGYGVPDDLARLAALFFCPVFLLARPGVATGQAPAGRGRDLAIALAFLAFLVVAMMVLAIMFFPAQH